MIFSRRYTWGIIALLIVCALFIFLFHISDIDSFTSFVEVEYKDPPKQPNDWFIMQRSYPGESINLKAWRAARMQAEALRNSALHSSPQWLEAGPTNIGGRITALAAHPSNPNRILLGAADGGIWYSEDGGTNWLPVFDLQSSLSIGALASDPSDPNIFYAGTGEANGSGDSYPGDGIYKSIDGGNSWFFAGLEESYHIGRIAVNPQNSQQLFVAASGLLFGKNNERGIYRSEDEGGSWQRVLFVSDSTAGIDVAIHPAHPDTVYAAMWERIRYPGIRIAGGVTSGIYRSIDGGDNWNLLGNGLPLPSTSVGRIGISIAPSNPSVIYAIYADHPGYFDGIYKSLDSGDSWTRVNDGALSSLYSSFGWYFGNVYVDPTDENTVYALGVPMYKSINGGNSWFQASSGVHVDHHAIWIDPANPMRVILGNDGGLYISQNGSSSYTKINGLPITQFYAATVDFNNPERRYGGTQDNGSMRTLSGNLNDWQVILGGDGFYCIVDFTNPNVIYAEYQWGGLRKSVNGGNSFSSATNGISGSDRTNWMTPVVMDPTNPDLLYYGSQRLYKTTDGASSWSAISGDLSNGPYSNWPRYGTITTIAVAPTNPDVIYLGTDDGNVWTTPDSGDTWNLISASLPDRWVTRVAVDPYDEFTALVTFSGYRFSEYIGHIYRTMDGGQTWQDIGSNLPEVPIQVVVIDPENTSRYFVGTDFGVYITEDGGVSWSTFGTGLPASGVMDLVLHHPTRTLTTATHGRSMYKIDVSNLSVIQDIEDIIQTGFTLAHIYPNPFNNQSTIEFELAKNLNVSVAIYDLLGRRIKELANQTFPAGTHRLHWDGTNQQGSPASSGVYLVRLSAGDRQIIRRISLVK